MSIKISFFEYQPLWVEYEVEVEISNMDYDRLYYEEISLSDIVNKYEVQYGVSVVTDNWVGGNDAEYEGLEDL